eukprot:gene26385-32958_t
MWWSEHHYTEFKQSAVAELKAFIASNSTANAKDAIKALYQPESATQQAAAAVFMAEVASPQPHLLLSLLEESIPSTTSSSSSLEIQSTSSSGSDSSTDKLHIPFPSMHSPKEDHRQQGERSPGHGFGSLLSKNSPLRPTPVDTQRRHTHKRRVNTEARAARVLRVVCA